MSNPKRTEGRMNAILHAWKSLRSDKPFAGMALAEFEEKIKPSRDTRDQIAALQSQLDAATTRRDAADDETERLCKLVINSVKGDVAEGSDGELYGAMGFVRDSERDSGLTRRSGDTPEKPSPAS